MNSKEEPKEKTKKNKENGGDAPVEVAAELCSGV
jgi:F0F1-type ATP synthase assembly protein I